MPPDRSPRDRLLDILEAIAGVRADTASVTVEQFRGAPTVMRSTLYCLIVIGEAVRSLPDSLKERFPEIEWKKAQAMRNFAAHVYFAIDATKVWETLHGSLPVLERQIREVLEVVE